MMSGIHGVRQLTAAYAEVLLRKRKLIGRPKRAHNAWPDGQYDTAIAMRLRGHSDEQIAKALNRSVHGVRNKIGWARRAA